MSVSQNCQLRVEELLRSLYGDAGRSYVPKVTDLIKNQSSRRVGPEGELWNERDVVLITYGDQVGSRQSDRSALAAQHDFLRTYGLDELISTVHLLPFFPYTSDDGFSVADYMAVDSRVGDWSDVAGLGRSFDLMFDLVLNHCSQAHEWFQQFRKGERPGDRYFHVVDREMDLSNVTRPRVSRLLTPYQTTRGIRRVWTTFSGDQIDLNYENPELLLEMLRVLLAYAERGARIIRLDAIAFLWKKAGTSCIHLPQTHAVVKLMRTVLDEVFPGCILLTETNVPHDENVSYFGDGDEAQMVYQFSLAPLLLDAFLSENAAALNRWLAQLEPCQTGNTFLNFTASHDGVGVRPLEGLIDPARLNGLVQEIKQRGGRVSSRRNPDGTESPYELNITYFSALGDPNFSLQEHVRRFLSSQAVMLGLQGIPAVYFHSLLGTDNDLAGVQETGRARTINRRKFDAAELCGIVGQSDSSQAMVFEGYRKMLRVRREQPAFHPDVPQRVTSDQQTAVVSFVRETAEPSNKVLVAVNVTSDHQTLDLRSEFAGERVEDLLNDSEFRTGQVDLQPWQAVWLRTL